LTKLVNDTLTRDANGRGFDSRQVHQFIKIYENIKHNNNTTAVDIM